VSDLERSERFYTSCLGAVVESREPDTTMLRVFDTRLLLQKATSGPPALGIRALVFRGATDAQLADPDGTALQVTAPDAGRSTDESDIEQITERVLAYGKFVARGDLEGIADLFVHGGVSGDAHPEPAVGRAAVLELYRTTLATGGTERRLRVATTDLEIDIDAGTATCMSTFTVRPPGSTDEAAPIFVGRYADTFARIDGRWEFTRRHVHLDMTDDEAVRREGVNLG
jgi:ketosteroid isomerase-like protein